MTPVVALFCRPNSVYRSIPGVEVYDKARDALTWPGGCPVVAHPPCAQWSRLKAFARQDPVEKDLAIWAVDVVRRYGGVLEHPSGSSLFGGVLPPPNCSDRYGYTIGVRQSDFGHPARKLTSLYICGVDKGGLPRFHLDLGYPSRDVPSLSRRARESTPFAFAHWLVSIARSTLEKNL